MVMDKKFILRIDYTEDGIGYFRFAAVGVRDGREFFTFGPTPVKFRRYFTKEQAEKVAEQYSKWWKANFVNKKLDCVAVLEITQAIKEFSEWMLTVCEKPFANERVIRDIIRDYPAKEVTEIPIYI